MLRSLMKYHPRIGFTYMPNAKLRMPHKAGGYLLRTNSTGFRSDREFETERDPAIFRALMFGDSQLAGDGVINARRYSDLLEQEIPGFEAYNYGLSGTSPDQQLLAFEEFATVEHDLVVISVYVENIRRVTRGVVKSMDGDKDGEKVEMYYAKPYYELDGQDLVLRNVPVPKKGWALDALPDEYQDQVYDYSETNFYSRTYKQKSERQEQLAKSKPVVHLRRVVKNAAMKLSEYQPLPEYDNRDDPSWLLLRELLKTWIDASAAPVLLVPLPHHVYLTAKPDPNSYQARFAELAADSGCHLYDPLPHLWEFSGAERRSLWSDAVGHFSARGHEVMADLLEPVLTDLKAQLQS